MTPTNASEEARAMEAWDATRPIGMAFWHEIPPFYRERLVAMCAALAKPSPDTVSGEVEREKMYAVLRSWDVGGFADRVCSAKGHGSLPSDICEAELDAFGEDVIRALLKKVGIANLSDDCAGGIEGALPEWNQK